MVLLRSRRLGAILGTSIGAIQASHIEGLVTNGAEEAFDLDFKRDLYGSPYCDLLAAAKLG